MKTKVIVLGVVLTLGACVSDYGVHRIYDGPPLPASQIAIIKVPGDIDIDEVDGKSIITLLSGDPSEIQVLPGTHKIGLRYFQIFDKDDNMSKIKSHTVTKYLTAQAGRVYQVEHTSPTNLLEARKYAPHFDFTIREIGGSAANQVAASEKIGPQSAPAVAAGATAAAAVTAQSNAGPKSDISTAGRPEEKTTLEKLKYWWGQASDAERQNFRSWIEGP